MTSILKSRKIFLLSLLVLGMILTIWDARFSVCGGEECSERILIPKIENESVEIACAGHSCESYQTLGDIAGRYCFLTYVKFMDLDDDDHEWAQCAVEVTAEGKWRVYARTRGPSDDSDHNAYCKGRCLNWNEPQ